MIFHGYVSLQEGNTFFQVPVSRYQVVCLMFKRVDLELHKVVMGGHPNF